jgi:hypothetical protein
MTTSPTVRCGMMASSYQPEKSLSDGVWVRV